MLVPWGEGFASRSASALIVTHKRQNLTRRNVISMFYKQQHLYGNPYGGLEGRWEGAPQTPTLSRALDWASQGDCRNCLAQLQ